MIATALIFLSTLTSAPPDKFESCLAAHRSRSGHNIVNGVLNIGFGDGPFDSRTNANYRFGIEDPSIRQVNIVADFRRPLYVSENPSAWNQAAIFDTMVRTPSTIAPVHLHGMGSVIIESPTPLERVYHRIDIDRIRLTHLGDPHEYDWRRKPASTLPFPSTEWRPDLERRWPTSPLRDLENLGATSRSEFNTSQ